MSDTSPPAANVFNAIRPLPGGDGQYAALAALQDAGINGVERLPVCLRIILESVLRNCDGKAATEENVRNLAGWQAQGARDFEIPFFVSRVVLQDFTGVPLLADLAAMRDAAGDKAESIEPSVPVDLIVDHSVQVDHYGTPDAMKLNMQIEFERNHERYQFLKWGAGAFRSLKVVPPGIGIIHQINLERLARGAMNTGEVWHPDTVVGTDSHTTMINGVGVLGWGVGGIEAEAAMLGQPVYMQAPDIVGVHLSGKLKEGVTATDLVLTITEMLRAAKVVGKIVEFFGEGASALSVPDRATIANMAPEYGATAGFFPVDENTLDYFRATGRDEAQVKRIGDYYRAQGMFGVPKKGECDYSEVREFDLGAVVPSVAGPKRPQDRIALADLRGKFEEIFTAPVAEGGYGKDISDLKKRQALTDAPDGVDDIGDGDIVIAAITSCTNTSNPGVLLAAALLAKKAAEKGMRPHPRVKTSFAPGSRVAEEYLKSAGLMEHLENMGFHIVGYGCTTCIGNSGPLNPAIDAALADGLVAASVLSGNRNFEARVHQSVRANFLMSPPLVVAFALAGRINIDVENEPLGNDKDGNPVFLRDLWPSNAEVAEVMAYAMEPENYRRLYGGDYSQLAPMWADIGGGGGARYEWSNDSTYIRKPPFFDLQKPGEALIKDARALAVFGDSITTDHISPAGAIKPSSPAGGYLRENGVKIADFNSYGSRRGNHEVMMRGTFANVRIRNLAAGGDEGGVAVHHPSGEKMSIYDAAQRYGEEGVPLIVIAGEEYGTGSSRDWAAKGTRLLGVRAVIARSFERIHRSNLVGMGVLPFQFESAEAAEALQVKGDELFAIDGLASAITPGMRAELIAASPDGSTKSAPLVLRVDTPAEVEFLAHDGILPYVLNRLAA